MKFFTNCQRHGFTLFGECKKCEQERLFHESYEYQQKKAEMFKFLADRRPATPSSSFTKSQVDDYRRNTQSETPISDAIIYSSLTSESYDSPNYDNGASSGGPDTTDSPSGDFGGYGGGDFGGGGSSSEW